MSVTELWLPILLTGLATHVISTLAWMILPHHKPEWNRVPVEDELIDLLDGKQVPANQYMFPMAATPAEMQGEEFQAKQGRCRGMLILWDRPLNMGQAIGQTFAFFMVTAFVIGYLASMGLPHGATFLNVFRFVFVAGLLAYCFAHFPHVFWFRRRMAMELLDGLAHTLAASLIFAALWPGA